MIRDPESGASRAFLEITPKLFGMISLASETADLGQAPKLRPYVVRVYPVPQNAPCVSAGMIPVPIPS